MGHLFINQAFSSQRDIALAISLARPHTTLTLSHSGERPEITSVGTYVHREPGAVDRVTYQTFIRRVLSKSRQTGDPVTAMLATRGQQIALSMKAELEQQGIRLFAGATRISDLELCDDKAAFTDLMKKISVPTAMSVTVRTGGELLQAWTATDPDIDLCIKPAIDVYGAGFWIFNKQATRFETLRYRDRFEIAFPDYLEQFERRTDNEAYLLMEYLPGIEASVDALCDRGRIVSHVVREKLQSEGNPRLTSGIQRLGTYGPEFDLAERVAEAVLLDGLVNIQFKRDAANQPRILEVNTRPSGGIAMTQHSGIDLAALLVDLAHGHEIEPAPKIEPCHVRQVGHSVRID